MVGKFGKELRAHELVHGELFGHIHFFSKWFLNTYYVKSCVGHVYVWFVVIVMFKIDSSKLSFPNYFPPVNEKDGGRLV